MNKSAEMLHIALAGCAKHSAGPEEQQALEQRMIEDVQEPRGERERRGGAHAVRLEGKRKAEADKDDPDILDGVIGEQALEIVLHQRVEDAQHASGAGEHKDEHAPPPHRRTEQIEHDPDKAVDRDLGHHPAHQSGDMTRGGGMGERQPGMQRNETRLGAGANQHKDQHKRGDGGWRRGRPDRVETVSSAGSRKQAERKQERQRAEARHHEIDVAGMHILAHTMMRNHQRPRCERHALPGEKEREGVCCQHHQLHRGEKQRIGRQYALWRLLVTPIAEREQARGGGAERHHGKEKRGQRIDREMRAEPRQAKRQA